MDIDDTAHAPEPFPPHDDDHPTPLGPRVRWAGVVWGIVLAAVSAGGFWMTSTPDALAHLSAAARDLSVSTLIAVPALALGAAVLVTGVVGLLRRAQRARTASAHG